LALIRHPKNP